ncbi:MAG TPA: amidohydrolase family protein [Thermoanaerobaculia bacterium]
MRRLLALLLLATPLVADTVVFRNVNVISMTSEKVSENQTVVVTDGKIAAVTKSAKIPKGATVVDGRGKYLIPGLAEMHGHVPPANAPNGATEDTLFLYVASGITTVRGMLGHPGQLELREKSKRGEIVSPNLYLAGPSFNGQSVNSPDEAIAKVRAQKKEGWDLLKVHPGLTREEYDAMARTAREEGIRFGGHVPAEVGLEHAIEMGQETFDHIDGYVEALQGDQGPVDETKLAALVKKSKEAGVWIVPTSALWEVLMGTIPLETLRSYDELRYVTPATVENWSKAFNDRLGQLPRTAATNIVRNRVRILRALHEGGVRILMGTDAPQQFSVPGFSLHRELLRMREAGMSNYDILRSGTVTVGDYFAKQDSFGTIEPGKRADLVLLDANPLADIANVARINGVMVRGRWLSRAAIDEGLKRIDAKN